MRRHLPQRSRIAYDSSGMVKLSTHTPNLKEKSQILSGSEIERTLVRLAHEIVEKNNGVANLGLVGIMRRGVPLAQRLAKILGRIEKTQVPVGTLDITLYRDDLSAVGLRPEVRDTRMEFNIQDKDIVLVDDVLYTGRTARAALDALFDHGRPRRIHLCVLIDRGHRELPIEASFVGRKIQTRANEFIEVKLQETDDTDKVLLMEQVPEAQ
jgi:pyrimidine operon attenuation protein/uracil phosphoribosyltransferase